MSVKMDTNWLKNHHRKKAHTPRDEQHQETDLYYDYIDYYIGVLKRPKQQKHF